MPLSRKKACACCRAAKAQCNLATPTCSRCSKRRLQCSYEGSRSTPHCAPVRVGQIEIGPIDNVADTCPAGATQEYGQNGSPLDWSSIEQVAGSGLTGTPRSLGMPPLGSIVDAAADRYETLDTLFANPSLWLQNASPVTRPATEMLGQLTSIPGASKLRLRRRDAIKLCPITSIALGQLYSYPMMLIRGHRLPPFIHPQCTINEELAPACADSGSHQCLPQPLAICANMVQMFYSRTPATTDFVWETIYAEQARLHYEVRS
jgi:hypothetical protein